jgi:hypothetical protein
VFIDSPYRDKESCRGVFVRFRASPIVLLIQMQLKTSFHIKSTFLKTKEMTPGSWSPSITMITNTIKIYLSP